MKLMRRMGMAAAVVAAVLMAGVAIGGPKDTVQELSSDPTEFVAQMSELLMNGQDKERSKSAIAQLNRYMQTSNAAMQELFIATCQKMQKKKARPYPDYVNAMTTFEGVANSNRITGHNLEVWKTVLDKKCKNLTQLRNFFEQTDGYVNMGAIYVSRSVAWRVLDTDKVEFVEADGDINYNVGLTTLRCMSQNDSIDILETEGKYYSKTNAWLGMQGKITWERVGLPADKVYATFGMYNISTKQNEVTVAEKAEFYNKLYFEDPIQGTVSYKCVNRSTTYGKRYPKFTTGRNVRMSIPDLFDNIGYDGGFTQTGNSFIGSAGDWLPAEINIHRGDTVLAKFSAQSFQISDKGVESSETTVKISLDDGELTHPGLKFRYRNDLRMVELIRGSKGLERAKYRDTYHKMNVDANLIQWNIDGTQLYISQLAGSPMNIAYFESLSYYSEDVFTELWGMSQKHPLQQVADFSRYNGGGTYLVKDFADFMGLPLNEAIRMVITLSYDGFVDFTRRGENDEGSLMHATDRLYDYLKYNVGEKDYDEMRFISVDSSASAPNGYIDLETMDFNLRKVQGVQISDADNQNIYLTPANGDMTLKKNRDIDYDGKVEVGQVTATGKSFHFDYNDFQIRLDSIEEMKMDVIDSSNIVNGRYVKQQLGSTLTELSGVVQLNDPENKSGRAKTTGYPRMSSTTPAKIFYERGIKGEDGTTYYYDTARFYFIVDTFTFEDINNITNTNLPFTGVLHTSIFPDIRHDLVIREDKSLGFADDTPEEGLPLYGGKATFYKRYDLSNKGLRGVGDIVYSASKSTSYAELNADGEFKGFSDEDCFRFLQNHAEGNTRQMDVMKSTTEPTFPQIELGANQMHRDANNFAVPGKSQMKFFPNEDHMDFRNMEGKFYMFPNSKHENKHECKFEGMISVTPTGAKGVGRGDLDIYSEKGISKSTLESRAFTFTDHTIKADTSYFLAYALSEEQTDVVASGELRRDIINKMDGNIYTAKASITRGKYVNQAIREDSIVSKVCNDKAKGKRITKKLLSRSQETFIDFDKREGRFEYNSAGGNEKDFAAIKYTTMVKNYTWDLERGEETIGSKGSEGNRFVCTKERGDSLNFLVPIAVFDRNANVLRCEEVKFIDCADVRVNLKPEDIVTIRKNAEMDQLTRTRVVLRSDSLSHSFDNANVTILGAKEYKGHGDYTFVDNEGGKNIIFMSDIHTDDAVTEAKGTVVEDMPLDKWFAFKGATTVRGDRRLLEFDGGAKMRVVGAKGPRTYVRFNSILDPARVRIPIDKRTFDKYEGNGKDKADEIYHSFRISKDSTHIYSTYSEHYKDAADLQMIAAPTGYLYHNNIFERYEINTPEKIAKPDTIGTFMCYYHNEDAVTGFGAIDIKAFLTKKPTGKFDIRSAGDIRHDRKKDVITTNLLTEMDFYLHEDLAMMLYNDILTSKAPKCDSASSRYVKRLNELYDTASVHGIMKGYFGGFDPKTKKMLPNGPVFTFDGLAMTWSTPKKSYVCDTTVNLMMMHYLPINRKVKLQMEIFVRKNGGSRVRMKMGLDNEKWYYIDFRSGLGRGYDRLSMRSSNPDVVQTIGSIDIRDRRDRSRSTENLIASEDYLTKFMDGFGLNNIPDDAYAQADTEDILEGKVSDETENEEEESGDEENGDEMTEEGGDEENGEEVTEEGGDGEYVDDGDAETDTEAVQVEDYLNGGD